MQNNIVESAAAAEPQSLETLINQLSPLEFVTILHNEFDTLFQKARKLSETSGINQTLIDNLESASKIVSKVGDVLLDEDGNTEQYLEAGNQAIQAIKALKQELSKEPSVVPVPVDQDMTSHEDLNNEIAKQLKLASSLNDDINALMQNQSIPKSQIDDANRLVQTALLLANKASELVRQAFNPAKKLSEKSKESQRCEIETFVQKIKYDLAIIKHSLAQLQAKNNFELYNETVSESQQARVNAEQAVKILKQVSDEYTKAADECRKTTILAQGAKSEAERAIEQAQTAIEPIKAQLLEKQQRLSRTTQKIEDQKQSSWSTNNKILVGGSIGFFAGAGLGVGFSLGVNGFQEAILGLFINNVQECIANHPVVSIVIVSAICAVLALLLASIITKLIGHCFNKSNTLDAPNP